MKEKRFPHTRKPLHWRRQGMARGKLRSHRGERGNRGAEGKAERFPHRGSVPTSIHQPDRLLCSPAGAGVGWELRLGLCRSIAGRGLGLTACTQPEGVSAPKVARRESGKKSGPA